MTKKCTKCHKDKVLSDFGKASNHKDGKKSRCLKCERAWHAENYKKNPRKIIDRNKEWKQKNPTKVRQIAKNYLANNQQKFREYRLRRTFGLTIQQYDEMYLCQSGCCAVCKKHQSELNRVLCVDHDHSTGKIRKLLCHECNKALGLLYENIRTIESLAKYLRDHN